MNLYKYNPAILDTEIREYLPMLELQVQGKIPNALIEIWKEHNGFRKEEVDEKNDFGEGVWFYSITECINFNQYTHALLPGYIIIADDNGGDLVAMMKLGEKSEEIFINERNILYPMSIDFLENTGFSIHEWYELGCYMCFGSEPVSSTWGDVIIRLEKIPSNGLKGLFKIKKMLELDDWSIQKLIQATSSIPCDLLIKKYSNACRIALEINKDEKCVSLWKVSDPNYEMPIY
jgi:hypothetical protein